MNEIDEARLEYFESMVKRLKAECGENSALMRLELIELEKLIAELREKSNE